MFVMTYHHNLRRIMQPVDYTRYLPLCLGGVPLETRTREPGRQPFQYGNRVHSIPAWNSELFTDSRDALDHVVVLIIGLDDFDTIC